MPAVSAVGVVKALRTLLLAQLHWQTSASTCDPSPVHLHFVRLLVRQLGKVAELLPLPIDPTLQQTAAQADAEKAEAAAVDMYCLTCSVLMLRPLSVTKQPASCSKGDLELAHASAAQLLCHLTPCKRAV